MIEDDASTLRSVAWREVFPWLSLFRCFRPAIRFRALLIGALAAQLTVACWALLGVVLLDEEASEQLLKAGGYHACPWTMGDALVPDRPEFPSTGQFLRTDAESPVFDRSADPLVGTWLHLSRPFRELFHPAGHAGGRLFWLLCGLVELAIWAFFGSLLTRSAAVELAANDRIGLGAAVKHASAKWPACCTAVLLPLVAVGGAGLMMGLAGILLKADVGVFLIALAWPLFLLGGLLMVVLLVGLAFGWPLMWAAISAEGSDGFDALSRTYGYVFQRPLHYLFYALVATLLGIAGWIFVSNFAAGVIELPRWAAGWGAGEERAALVFGEETDAANATNGDEDASESEAKELRHVGRLGRVLIPFWASCVKILAIGFLYSYFWTASTNIYFLLRHDVDATEMDEVFLDEDEGQLTYGLPPLGTDAAGAPIVAGEPQGSDKE